MTAKEMQHEALARAKSGNSTRTEMEVIAGFAARGIDATPRVDTFTYNAWKALGRQVRRGEKGVRVMTWIPINDKKTEEQKRDKKNTARRLRPKMATVFHKSQTEPAS